MTGKNGVVRKVLDRWHFHKNLIISFHPDFRRRVRRRIAQRTYLQSLDIAPDKKKEVIAVTKHAIRLDDARDAVRNHSFTSQAKAISLLKRNQGELIRIIRKIHADEHLHQLELECGAIRKLVSEKMHAIEGGSEVRSIVDVAFLDRIHRVYDQYLKTVLGEEGYGAYHRKMKLFSDMGRRIT